MYKKYIKNFFDRLFGLILLLVASPILLICSLLIKIDDPAGPILFKQKRVGKSNKPFTIMKLRSMKTNKMVDGEELSDEARMLRIGFILRKLSLDELPQLINILRGEMSFIGPRPLPVVYYPYYSDRELKRHEVKPGISGLAQVNGRNNLSWEEKFEYDLEYIENLSFVLDLKIFKDTIFKVFKRSDVKLRKTNGIDQSLDEIRHPVRKTIF